MYIILGNFGNHSLAALQHLLEKDKQPLHFLYVKTGWEASHWNERVNACVIYAEKKGVNVHALSPKQSFEALVKDRGHFPSQKFQWCTSFLKGLPISDKLDELDFTSEAVIVSGKRRQDSRRFAHLNEIEENNELFQGRTCWYPLLETDDMAFEALINRTGFPFLEHPALECSPCIHLDPEHRIKIDSLALQRLTGLENEVSQSMFPHATSEQIASTHSNSESKSNGLRQFDRGCGAAWCCGE